MFSISRRMFITGAASAALLAAGPTLAADWPERPVTVVVTQAAGNSPDVLCRIITDKLSRELGQQFIVENRPGAANVVGMQSAARAANDGYTFVFATSAALVTNPYTIKALSYDPVKDFVPVAMVAKSHHVLLVNPEVKANSLAELIALEKAAPGSLSIAVDGPRNISGLIAQAINKEAGTQLVLVPYNAVSNAVQDSISGRTGVTIQSASVAAPYIKDGSLRAIAVAGNERIASLPDVPAISETLKSIELQGWFMVLAPAGTPDAIVDAMSKAIDKALAETDVQERAPTLGFEVAKGDVITPAGAKAFLGEQLSYTGTVIKSLGIEPN
jgi:tripartite-type tricarboxylate transporter receptor subunit TctC